jgi:hypothetical protein
MNDSKYGRLYPERAVAPLREAAVEILDNYHGIAGAVREALKNAVNGLDDDGFPPDEPLFLLRGQDELAPDTIRFYADLVEARDADLDIDRLIACANRMRAWQPRKLPD